MAGNAHGYQTKVTTYLEPGLLDRLDNAAHQAKRSRNNLITVAVTEYLDTHYPTHQRRR